MDNTIIILSIICCSVLLFTIIFYLIYKYYIWNNERNQEEQVRNQHSVITFSNLSQKNNYPPAPPYDFTENTRVISKNEYFDEENVMNDNYNYYQNDYYQNDYFDNNYYDNSINNEGLNDYFNVNTRSNYNDNIDFFNQDTYV
jgi:hypothetical protein